jgi:hypothetical protein
MENRQTTIQDTEHFVFLPHPYEGFDAFMHRTKKINGLVSTEGMIGRIVYVSLSLEDGHSHSVSGVGDTFEEALRSIHGKIEAAKDRIEALRSLFVCDGDHAGAPCLAPECWLNHPEDGIPAEPKPQTEGGAQ